jgi:hypothetical protein
MVSWREGKALRVVEGKMLGSGVCYGYRTADEKSGLPFYVSFVLPSTDLL